MHSPSAPGLDLHATAKTLFLCCNCTSGARAAANALLPELPVKLQLLIYAHAQAVATHTVDVACQAVHRAPHPDAVPYATMISHCLHTDFSAVMLRDTVGSMQLDSPPAWTGTWACACVPAPSTAWRRPPGLPRALHPHM